ncbi:MAG: hypothetical protein QXI12_00480 [Candidatus Methanomethyliaceae archaeon]
MTWELGPELGLVFGLVDSWLELMPCVVTYVVYGGPKPRGVESARFSRETADGFLLWPTGRGWIEEYLAEESGTGPGEVARELMVLLPKDTRVLWLKALDLLIEKGAVSPLDSDVRTVYTAVAETLSARSS